MVRKRRRALSFDFIDLFSEMPFAPIALFAYRRPHHVRLALRSLMLNPEWAQSPIHIYCDGPRTAADRDSVRAARAVVRELAPEHSVIVERAENLGLDRSVVRGVSELCERHGRVIVIEDDLEVAPDFLRYMNAALDRYVDDERVMQVSGYQFPVKIGGDQDAVFLPYTTSWGWATWARAWSHFDHSAAAYTSLVRDPSRRRAFDLDGSFPYFRMLASNLKKPVPAWDVLFYLTLFDLGALVLHPARSKIVNNGFDGSGTSCGKYAVRQTELGSGFDPCKFPDSLAVDVSAFAAVRAYLGKESRFTTKMRRKLAAYVQGSSSAGCVDPAQTNSATFDK